MEDEIISKKIVFSTARTSVVIEKKEDFIKIAKKLKKPIIIRGDNTSKTYYIFDNFVDYQYKDFWEE